MWGRLCSSMSPVQVYVVEALHCEGTVLVGLNAVASQSQQAG